MTPSQWLAAITLLGSLGAIYANSLARIEQNAERIESVKSTLLYIREDLKQIRQDINIFKRQDA